MLESFPIAVMTGLALGYLAGLGVGGGSLLILWLTLVLHMDQPTARAINLMFFIVAACAVSIFRWRQGKLNLRKVLPAILSGCVAAFLFSLWGKNMDVSTLKRFFGFLLLATGIRELLYKPRNKEG